MNKNPLVSAVTNNSPFNGAAATVSLQDQYMQYRRNPLGFLISKNINIPQEYIANPLGAVQYLLNTGQMTQEQLNRLSGLAQSMGVRLN